MTATSFEALAALHGSDVIFHREDSEIPCPCLTPEGYRDPVFHTTDLPYLTASYVPGGNFTGKWQYYLAFEYPNGEKFPGSILTLDMVSQNPHFIWNGPSPNPPTQIPAVNAVLYRRDLTGLATWTLSNPLWQVSGVFESANSEFVDVDTTYSVQPTDPQPLLQICNEEGMIPIVLVDMAIKAFIQPVSSGRIGRVQADYLMQAFGDIRTDDHIGVFPIQWNGFTLDLRNWGASGEDFIEWEGRKFQVIGANRMTLNNLPHHWECSLRLINSDPVVGSDLVIGQVGV